LALRNVGSKENWLFKLPGKSVGLTRLCLQGFLALAKRLFCEDRQNREKPSLRQIKNLLIKGFLFLDKYLEVIKLKDRRRSPDKAPILKHNDPRHFFGA
jgi:hypothetical protein